MSGDIRTGPGPPWSASWSVFAWVLDRLAEQVTDPALARDLQEISDENLGWLDVTALPLPQQVQVRRALQALPGLGAALLPDTPGKGPLVQRLQELADASRP